MTCVLVLLALGAMGSEAWGERVSLEYTRTRDAAACPPADAMQDMVRDRLGYDPFRTGARKVVRVAMDATAARIDVLQDGIVVGTRSLVAPAGCVELTETVALAVSIAIDPRAAAAAARRPRSVAAFAPRALVGSAPDIRPGFRDVVPRTAGAPAEAVATASSRQRQPTALYVSAGLVAAVGTGPEPAAGAVFGVGMGQGAWSLALEGRYDQQTSTAFGPGRVHARLRFGALVPCLRRGIWNGCAVVAAGSLVGSGEGFDQPREARSAFVAAGGRVAVDAVRFGPVRGRVYADGLGAIARGRLLVSGMDAWTLPAWSGAVGFAAVGQFR